MSIYPPRIHEKKVGPGRSQAWLTLSGWKYPGDCWPLRLSDIITISVLSWLVWDDEAETGEEFE